MSNVFITGGNGVLGSALANMFLERGDTVGIVDIVRKEECWRLKSFGIDGQVNYLWKASQDLSVEDVKGYDIVIDCAIGFPDRPFGTSSPRATASANVEPALGLLEAVRKLEEKPLIIYPSSFNSLYGNTGTYSEETQACPTTLYGWTKGAVEQLYRAYSHSFGVPSIVTRVGSSFGEMMRTDELVAKLIISGLRGSGFTMKSPLAKRLWTYLGDVLGSYGALVNECDYGSNHDFIRVVNQENRALNIAGNLGDSILTNIELSKLVGDVTGSEASIEVSDDYEPGELVNGRPVGFELDARWTREVLRWQPSHDLRESLSRTASWFSQNLEKVGNWNQ